MILLSQWYEPDDADRLAELKSVRKANESSGLFEQTVYVDGKDRHSFGRLFDYAASNHPGEVCVIANTDILFDQSASIIPSCCKPNRLVAITRWEPPYTSPRMQGHLIGENFFSGSQDVWAFIAGGMPELKEDVPLGYVACDQVIAGWAATRDCEVVNPCLSVRAMHVHKGEGRSWGGVLGGLLGYPEPSIASEECTGLILVHRWPFEEGERQEGKVFPTCRP